MRDADYLTGGDHPYLRILSDDKLRRIRAAVLEILGTIGVKVCRPAAVEMMAAAGCPVAGEVVRMPPEVVERALESAPKAITVYNREGEEALHLGGPDVYTHTGYTPLDFFDLDTGERRPYTLDDFRAVARVADALPNVDVVGQPGVVRPSAENPLEVINHLEVEAMLTNTSKPLHVLVASGGILSDCLDMADAIAVANGARSHAEKPFMLAYANPISPLTYNEDTVDKVLIAADRNVPIVCGPMPLAGGTSPVTMAGSIAQAVAESLAGLVISQVRRAGAPYIMTASAATIDMRTGNVVGGPERELMVSASIEMGQFYGVPIKGGFMGGGTRGVLDAESGWQQMMCALMRMLRGGSAGLGVGPGSSLEACVMADEMVGMLKAMMRGVPVDDETLAVDVIREVGPGGNFLGHAHTFRHFRDRWEPTLAPRMRYEEWVAAGRVPFEARVKERLRHILATHRPKPIPDRARWRIDEIIARARSRVPAPV